MTAVVAAARGLAGPGDTVLLAPAGASFDQFSGYAERGDAFAAAVPARDPVAAVSNILTRLRLPSRRVRHDRRPRRGPPTGAGPRTRFGAWLGRPMTSFHLIIAVAALLTTLGLIMVLSASGVHSYDEDGSPWVIFGKQVIWTLVGLFAFYAAMRMRVQTMRSLAFTGFAVSIVLLVLVLIPGIGKEANGSRGWFVVAGFSMQPSELAKIAFAIWGAHLLAARRMERASLREMLIPLVPAAVIALALIVAQPDLGQTVSLGIILLACCGTPACRCGCSCRRCSRSWCRRRCWRCRRATGPTG